MSAHSAPCLAARLVEPVHRCRHRNDLPRCCRCTCRECSAPVPLSLGIIEGVAEAVNSLLKIVSGYASDRWSKRRPIVIAGYALSSAARPLIALTKTLAAGAAHPRARSHGQRHSRRAARRDAGAFGDPRPTAVASSAFTAPWTTRARSSDPLSPPLSCFSRRATTASLFALTIIPGAIAVALLFLVPRASRRRRPRPAGPRERRLAGTTSDPLTGRCSTFLGRAAALQPGQLRRRIPAAALVGCPRQRDVRPAAVGRPSRRQSVALDVGWSALGPARAQARHRHRLGDLRPRVPRLRDGARARGRSSRGSSSTARTSR